MAVKNRSERARQSVVSLVTPESVQYFDFIIIEDVSPDLVNLSQFPLRNHVTHYVIETGDIWNRSKVLNYGFKRAVTPFVTSWDADFVFPSDFLTRFLHLLDTTDFSTQFLQLAVTETHEGFVYNGQKMKRGAMWGGMYTYLREYVCQLNGYDEGFYRYGHEERDFNNRLELGCGCSGRVIEEQWLVHHMTHGDNLRNYNAASRSCNFQRLHRNQNNGITIVNLDKPWGESRLISCNPFQR